MSPYAVKSKSYLGPNRKAELGKKDDFLGGSFCPEPSFGLKSEKYEEVVRLTQ
jgi:hypothetical protein